MRTALSRKTYRRAIALSSTQTLLVGEKSIDLLVSTKTETLEIHEGVSIEPETYQIYPDASGSRILCGSKTGIKVLEVGKSDIVEISGLKGDFKSIALHEKGEYIIVSLRNTGHLGSYVRVLSAQDMAPVGKGDFEANYNVTSVGFSPHSDISLTAGGDGRLVQWDISDSKIFNESTRQNRVVRFWPFPDGSQFLVAVERSILSSDQTTEFEIVDCNALHFRRPVFQLESPAREVSFSPNGKYIATFEGSSGCKIWKFQVQWITHFSSLHQMIWRTRMRSKDSTNWISW